MPETEQPTISLLVNRKDLMPNGSIGSVCLGEFAGDRSKDLRLTFEQANTLVLELIKAGFGVKETSCLR